MPAMSRIDALVILLSLIAVLATGLVTERVFEGVPHIEDEIAYVWQADVIATGQLAIPSPPHPKSYLVPFVVDYDGLRFGKYPLGWPALLSIGVRLGIRHWVNPVLAGLAVWLTYCLGKRTFSQVVALLAAGLTLTSPFFMMNSGSLLSHPFGLVLSATFALAWLDAFWSERKNGRWLPTLVAGCALGVLILTRPYTAFALSLPFGLHGLYLLLRGDRDTRLRLLVLGILVLLFIASYFLWQYALTGDFWLNPYTLWWSYDKVGFGPGHGHTETGHTLRKAYVNTRHSLRVGIYDLFGWGAFSWIFLPFGLWAARRNYRALLLASLFPSLVILYLAYWIGSWLFGPRYFYESLYALTIISAAGIATLAGWPVNAGHPDPGSQDSSVSLDKGKNIYKAGFPLIAAVARLRSRLGTWFRTRLPRRSDLSDLARRCRWGILRPSLVAGLLAFLILINLRYYTPMRLSGMHGLYGISRANQEPFLAPETQSYAPALIVVHSERWMGYGSLLDLQDPLMTTPFVFAWSIGPSVDAKLGADFPGRAVYHYYLDEPYIFYTAPRPDP